ncbi:hypothetical protein ACQKI4_10830 [Paenibacillus glucanolyticus]|jgi:hypothetical protein|nr:hypothetical protein [Paenibacillus glucanolyticus]
MAGIDLNEAALYAIHYTASAFVSPWVTSDGYLAAVPPDVSADRIIF